MTLIPGYEDLEKIGEGYNTVLFRAYQLRNKQTVILKVPNEEYPYKAVFAQLKHEYEITSRLDIAGVLNPLALERLGHVPMLALEDYSGSPINNFEARFRSDIAIFLQLAIQVSITLGDIHRNNLIHKRINPDNIFCDPEMQKYFMRFAN